MKKKSTIKKVPTKENLDLRYKVMLNRMSRLEECFILIPYKENNQKLDILKKKYVRMYEEMLRQERFDTYVDIEDSAIEHLARLEYDLDRYIVVNKPETINIIERNIKSILDSKDFNNCTNLDELLNTLQAIKDIHLRVSPYIDEIQRNELLQQILKTKFQLLYKTQKLLLSNGEADEQYPFKGIENDDELEIYQSIINEKLQALRELKVNDSILKIKPDEILKGNNLLNRLLVLEIYYNSNEHIDLLTMPIFNIHNCTLVSAPDDRIKYATTSRQG